MTFVTQVNTTNEDAITALELLSIGVSLDALLDYVRIGVSEAAQISTGDSTDTCPQQLVLQAVFATIAFMTVLNYWLRSKQDPWYIKALVTLMSGFTLTQKVLSNIEFARLIRECVAAKDTGTCLHELLQTTACSTRTSLWTISWMPIYCT